MRVFVGLSTPAEVDDAVDAALAHAMRAWARAGRVTMRWVPGEERHVTVRFVGDCTDPEPVIDAVAAAADGLAAPVLGVGPMLMRLTATALVLPVDGARPLAAAVAHALRMPLGTFTGHMTLARVRRQAPPPPTHEPVAVSWTPRTLDVIESCPGGAPRFRTLAQAALAG